MPPPVFLGDEVTAAGYRLAGARVRSPPPGEEVSFLEWARREAGAELVILSAEFAAHIPSRVLKPVLAATSPLVIIVPDLWGHGIQPDLATRLRTQLGIER